MTAAEHDPPAPAIPGFRSLITHHCVTGSMCHIYAFHGHPVTEELLLGLGRGVGFVYWHQKGSLPFLGGRANVGRPGEEGLERTAGRRTGVAVAAHETSSARKAEAILLDLLATGEPVMLQVDMGELPYLRMPPGFHFGGHVIVAAGFDPVDGHVLVADRDAPLHAVSLEDLERARGSECHPWPPRRRWWTFDFRAARRPSRAELLLSISEAADAMLHPPIANLGVAGIRKTAVTVPRWPETLPDDQLAAACRGAAVMIEATGGTGGGLFRFMFDRFLIEAADTTGDRRLWQVGTRFHAVGERWEELAALLREASMSATAGSVLALTRARLDAIADAEEDAWRAVTEVTADFSQVREESRSGAANH